MMDKCNWCEPGHEVCGTCRKFFDYYGDGTDKCSADFSDTDLCSGYDSIDYCPNCGRKLRTEDGRCHALGNCENKTVTKADRIRAMSDEDLADFIRDVSHECQDAYSGSCMRCEKPWCSSNDTEKWLKQKAEE